MKTCGDCRHLGAAIDSGIRYCSERCTFEWAHTPRGEPVIEHAGDMFFTAFHCEAWAPIQIESP